MSVCLELSLTVHCICHQKPPKERLAPPKLPQVHLVYIAIAPFLPAASVESVAFCAAMRQFGLLVLFLGDSRSRIPFPKQGEELDSPQHVLAGSHKEDGPHHGRG